MAEDQKDKKGIKLPITRRQFFVAAAGAAAILGTGIALGSNLYPRTETKYVEKTSAPAKQKSEQLPEKPYSPQPIPQNSGRMQYGEGIGRGLGETSNDIQKISGIKADFLIDPNKRSPLYYAFDQRNRGNGHGLNYTGNNRGVEKIVNGRRDAMQTLLQYMLDIDPVRDGDDLRILHYLTKAVIDAAIKR